MGERSDILSTAQVVEDRVMGLPRFRLTVRRLMVGVAFGWSLFGTVPPTSCPRYPRLQHDLHGPRQDLQDHRSYFVGGQGDPTESAGPYLPRLIHRGIGDTGRFILACHVRLRSDLCVHTYRMQLSDHTQRNLSRTWPAHPRRRLGGVPMCLHAQEEFMVRTG